VVDIFVEQRPAQVLKLDQLRNGSGRVAHPRSRVDSKVAATMVAAGIGVACLGIVVTLAEAVAPVGNILDLYDPVGNLSGKTTVAVVAWLMAWFVLQRRWRFRAISARRTMSTTIALIGVGVLGTFPPFFDVVKSLLA
jgi:hypothetical protein